MANFDSLKKRIYSVNAKILNMERRYGKDSNIVKRVYDTIERIYGEGVTRYRYPKTDSLREINKISRGVSLIENSLYASAAGRKKLREKSFAKFFANEQRRLEGNKKGRVITEKTIEVLYDIFENATDWDRIRELSGYKTSGTTIDYLERQIESGKSADYIINIMSEYMNYLKKSKNKSPDKDFLEFFDEKLYMEKMRSQRD